MSTPYARSADGSVEYRFLTPKYLDDALNLMKHSFYPNENVCMCIGVSKNPQCLTEFEELTRKTAEDGVTLIAVDKSTDKVIGASFNKIQTKGKPGEVSFFENFAKNCHHPETLAVLDYMFTMDEMYNLFDNLKIDCLLEIMFLATAPQCRGKGVGSKLCELSVEIAAKLSKNEKLYGTILTDPPPRPQAVSAIFTSHITQRIGKKLGFTKVAERTFEQYKNYKEIIGEETKTVTLEYKMME